MYDHGRTEMHLRGHFLGDKPFQLVVLALLTVGAVSAENIDPANDGSQYAYAENVGWMNAEPNGDGADGIQVDSFTLTGYMWGENIGWVSLSCDNTSTCGQVAYGVEKFSP